MSSKEFVEKSEWIKGPDFLKEPVESWLKEEIYEEHVDADSPEVKDFNVNGDIDVVNHFPSKGFPIDE